MPQRHLTAALLLIPLATSCASIVSDSDYGVSVQSAPSGASFVIHDEDGVEVHRGVTPETVTLAAGSSYFDKEEYLVTFSLAGMPDRAVPFAAKLDGWYLGNILFGGLIGLLVVDPISGAMFRLDEELVVELGAVAP
ncbi:MAG: hypothetical protein AAF682_20720 [Planctomycetota bacterium]